MTKQRPVVEARPSVPTVEGAGVRLRRAFGEADPRLDPFLLLDDFHSDDPRDYLAGFPWHPHRGIETITYMLHGLVEHGDSLGNRGLIRPGEVQWMTAGRGIIHQEMPREPPDRLLHGFQLWANLPAARKMMGPRYREALATDIPVVDTSAGARVKVICGEFEGVSGPVRDIVTGPRYFDVSLAAGGAVEVEVAPDHNVFAYTVEGTMGFGPGPGEMAGEKRLVIFGEGRVVSARAGQGGGRFLLVSGRPLREPVAWGGPIVMNTEAELREAFREYEAGTFLDRAR